MHNLLICYAPDSPENRKAAEEIQASVDGGTYSVTVKPARESSVVDIAHAELMLFGCQKAGSADTPADFDELLRIFKGANLAGKTCAFFALGTEKASGRLRRGLRDTDISVMEDEPVLADRGTARSGDIREWTRKVTAYFQETLRARR
jgi:hypothetical protein